MTYFYADLARTVRISPTQMAERPQRGFIAEREANEPMTRVFAIEGGIVFYQFVNHDGTSTIWPHALLLERWEEEIRRYSRT